MSSDPISDPIFEQVRKDLLTEVRYGDAPGEFMLSWAAGGVLRKLHERHGEIFSALLAEVVSENQADAPENAGDPQDGPSGAPPAATTGSEGDTAQNPAGEP